MDPESLAKAVACLERREEFAAEASLLLRVALIENPDEFAVAVDAMDEAGMSGPVRDLLEWLANNVAPESGVAHPYDKDEPLAIPLGCVRVIDGTCIDGDGVADWRSSGVLPNNTIELTACWRRAKPDEIGTPVRRLRSVIRKTAT